MLKPVRMPLLTAPIDTTPVSAGASVTAVPGIGVNVSSGVGDDHSSAVIVTVVPTSARPTVLLKYAAMDVMVPSLGIEKAKLLIVASVMSGVVIITPVNELPNPIKDPVPTSPPAIDVIMIGVFEA
jgi:hypothetical protein